jgi:hypothetical protein
LYDSSVYKLEDQLFELLGGKEQKPKEIPVDIILLVSIVPFLAPFAIRDYKKRVKTGLV